MCMFWAKANLDTIYWGKHDGDGKQLTPMQSMLSGGSAAFLGPIATGPFDVIKVRITTAFCCTAITASQKCCHCALVGSVCDLTNLVCHADTVDGASQGSGGDCQVHRIRGCADQDPTRRGRPGIVQGAAAPTHAHPSRPGMFPNIVLVSSCQTGACCYVLLLCLAGVYNPGLPCMWLFILVSRRQ